MHSSFVHLHYCHVHVICNLCIHYMHADRYVNCSKGTPCTGTLRAGWAQIKAVPLAHKSFFPLSSPLKYLQLKSAFGAVHHTAALVNDIRAGFKKKIPCMCSADRALLPTWWCMCRDRQHNSLGSCRRGTKVWRRLKKAVQLNEAQLTLQKAIRTMECRSTRIRIQWWVCKRHL